MQSPMPQHDTTLQHGNKTHDFLKKNSVAWQCAIQQNKEWQRKALSPNLGAKHNAMEQRVMPQHEE